MGKICMHTILLLEIKFIKYFTGSIAITNYTWDKGVQIFYW